MNHDEKMRILERSVIESNEGYPGSHLIVRDDWAQIITPGAKGSASNAVYRSIVSLAEIESKVNSTCDSYEAMQVPFRWVLTPHSRPLDTARLLERRGLQLLYEATAMIQSVDLAISPIHSALEVRDVELAQADLYVDTFMRCWELPIEMKVEFRDGVIHGLKDSGKKFRPYVAFSDDEPIGTAALLILPSGAYLAAGTVRKDYRGRGIYRALLSHRARVAKSLGLGQLLIHAKNHTAAPICRRLGFEPIYQHQVYSKEK
jgi:GNAT superfamily N-acetyltransferase